MSPSIDGSLSKEDLFLLLESYKNSVEMNTIISQQLNNILDIIKQQDFNLSSRIDNVEDFCDKIKDKLDGHNIESIKNIGVISNCIGKLTGKINLLYVAFGSIVISLIILIITIVDKYDLIKAIASNLGVG